MVYSSSSVKTYENKKVPKLLTTAYVVLTTNLELMDMPKTEKFNGFEDLIII